MPLINNNNHIISVSVLQYKVVFLHAATATAFLQTDEQKLNLMKTLDDGAIM